MQAIHARQSVQGIDVQELRKKLLEQNAVLELAELASMVRSAKLPGIVMDDQQAERTGHWTGSSYGHPVDGASIHDANAEKGALSIRYILQAPASGRYEVRVSYAFAPNRASNVPLRIQHAAGEERPGQQREQGATVQPQRGGRMLPPEVGIEGLVERERGTGVVGQRGIGGFPERQGDQRRGGPGGAQLRGLLWQL